ncbi:MAG: hypothetical protein KF784_04600 [Fimbriimonadaceae bacterium]|nr:hypothetical protein [Fimbriimonadaceae bacterium]
MKRVMLLAALAATIGTSAAASAQKLGDVTPYNFAFRIGLVYPVNDNLRDINDNFILLGADYTFTSQYLKNSDTFLSIDYIAKALNGDQGSYWPILINQRFYGQDGMYWMVGAGIVNADFTRTDTVFGARVGVGKNLGPNIFAEASFFWSDKIRGDLHANSIGFSLGYRF